jgi:hypothetical protein
VVLRPSSALAQACVIGDQRDEAPVVIRWHFWDHNQAIEMLEPALPLDFHLLCRLNECFERWSWLQSRGAGGADNCSDRDRRAWQTAVVAHCSAIAYQKATDQKCALMAPGERWRLDEPQDLAEFPCPGTCL